MQALCLPCQIDVDDLSSRSFQYLGGPSLASVEGRELRLLILPISENNSPQTLLLHLFPPTGCDVRGQRVGAGDQPRVERRDRVNLSLRMG